MVQYTTAARGGVELDIAIENIQLVNVFTGEIYPAAIGMKGEKIAHVTQPGVTELAAAKRVDGKQQYAIPGLIDTHVHMESSMLTPEAYAKAVLPQGTTTVVTDPHEIGNVLGERGIRYMIEASRELDLRVLTFLPSCVPSAPAVETSGDDFTPEKVRELLKMDGIDGLAEVMNYYGVIHEDPRMTGILAESRQAGMLAQGHAPTVSDRELSAYLMAGVDSDHESRTGDEALEKVRAGMWLEIRESSFAHNAAPIAEKIRHLGYMPNICLCSDDVKANHLLTPGHMNHVARTLIKNGIDPITAIRFGTINAANRLRRSDIGAIAPGRDADVALVNDLENMTVTATWARGKLVGSEGICVRSQPRINPPEDFFNTVKVEKIVPEDFHIGIGDGAEKASVRVIEYDYAPGIPTNFFETTLPVENGLLKIGAYEGRKAPLNVIGVFHRHGKNTNRTLGVLAGYGITDGAVATTVAHDSHHLAVLGVDPGDMAIAANHLRDRQGGMVAVKNGEVIAELALPVAGLMSQKSADELAPLIETFVERIQETIMPGLNPIHRLIAVTLPVIPKAKISDQGLVDVDEQRLVSLITEVYPY
ncbi:adenine deaminase [Salibacterium salarium]|uniref:adenine deaminase n=1 Tax=Salibacterium salarium TaxID=284579 RepID=UPI0027800EBB|nr:adenine deaminase [Salibacterium salarium]MDQ0300179.1 adenine deaminase [Salibacterium salarium]